MTSALPTPDTDAPARPRRGRPLGPRYLWPEEGPFAAYLGRFCARSTCELYVRNLRGVAATGELTEARVDEIAAARGNNGAALRAAFGWWTRYHKGLAGSTASPATEPAPAAAGSVEPDATPAPAPAPSAEPPGAALLRVPQAIELGRAVIALMQLPGCGLGTLRGLTWSALRVKGGSLLLRVAGTDLQLEAAHRGAIERLRAWAGVTDPAVLAALPLIVARPGAAEAMAMSELVALVRAAAA